MRWTAHAALQNPAFEKMMPPPSEPSPEPDACYGEAQPTNTDFFKTAFTTPGELGRFQIIRELNKGNLGVVYVAVDRELHRDIALKHIREDRAHDASARDHFMREAEVTGKLEHPGIVPVYSLSSDGNDRLYYAMRLIRGIDLRTAITLFHQAVADGRVAYDGPELRELIRNLVSVCHTMAYAHSRGVLHRDLKPANIMLGPFGETLVVDWGLAKATGQTSCLLQVDNASVHSLPSTERPIETTSSQTEETEMGSVLCTPAYAPPEQLCGNISEIDHRSDIYSLGVILFEILTGTLPNRCKTLPELTAETCSGLLPAPREVLNEVPAAISAICQRAMRAKREDRYQDVQEYRKEIECWLNDRPVQAYRESPIEQVHRWMRTHQSYVRGGIASLVVICCVSMLALYLINGALTNEAKARKEATELYQLARTTTESLLLTTNDRLMEIPDATDIRQELLNKASQSYQKMADTRTNDIGLQREAASAQLGLAAVQRKLGQSLAAIETLQKSTELLEKLVASPEAVLADRFMQVEALIETSRVCTDLPRDAAPRRQALPAIARALSILENVKSSGAADSRFWILRGRALIQQGIIKGDEDEALAATEANRSAVQALRSGIETATEQPFQIELRHQLARALLNLGVCVSDRDPDNPEVQSSYEAALENLQWCIERDPTSSGINLDLGLVHSTLADYLLLDKGDRQRANTLYTNSRNFFARLVEKHPLVMEYKQGLIPAMLGLGYLAYRNNKPEEAESQYRAACLVADQLMLQNSVRISFRITAALAKFHLGELLTDSQPEVALPILSSAADLIPAITPNQVDPYLADRERIKAQIESVKLTIAVKKLNYTQPEGLGMRLNDFVAETQGLTRWPATFNTACYISLACQSLEEGGTPLPELSAPAQAALDKLRIALRGDGERWINIEQDSNLHFLHQHFETSISEMKPTKPLP